MKINILTENRARKRGFLAEHGLSIYIESEEANILFDTGQSDVYIHNASAMNVDLQQADCVVLSHGHYDHCGGLVHFPKSLKTPKIYVQKSAFGKRYALNSDGKTYREIGIPWSLTQQDDIKNHLVYTQVTTKIAPNVFLCGEIPFTTPFEGVPSGFFLGEEKKKDMLQDEQMLIFNKEEGLYIFLGCSHPGVVNCLQYAKKLFPSKKINTVVAGMHLGSVDPLRLQKTMEYLANSDIQKLVPLHCTGIFAIAAMKHLLGDRCYPLCVGETLDI